MGFLSANWLWIVLIGAMVLMHLRHGRMHGSHHGSDHEGHGDSNANHDHGMATSAEAGSSERGHRHGGTGNAHEMVRRPDRSLPALRSWLRPDAARLVRLTPQEISGRRLPPVPMRFDTDPKWASKT